MLREFREFMSRGSVVDLAVGIIVGAAFTAIVNSLVNDILMPPLGFLLGGLDFSNYFFALSAESFSTLEEAKKAGVATINYGLFINAVLKFLIVGFAIFILVKQVNRFRKQEEKAVPAQEVLLTEIRDLLKAQSRPPAA